MKILEKILVPFFIATFLLRIFELTSTIGFLALSTWLLSALYFVGGYWLFKSDKESSGVFAILTGIVFSSSLLNMPFLVVRNMASYFNFIPIANGLLFLALVIVFFKSKNMSASPLNIKGSLIRSFFILVISAVFTYIPLSFKPFKALIYSLNYGSPNVILDLKIVEYKEKSKHSLNQGNCDLAIRHCLNAVGYGQNWIGLTTGYEFDSMRLEDVISKRDTSNRTEHKDIGQLYMNLFQALDCKAKELYTEGSYEEALDFYTKADDVIYYYLARSRVWMTELAHSKNRLAICYKRLQNFEYSDSLFLEAVNIYEETNDTLDINVAKFYTNLAKSLYERNLPEYSIIFNNESILILERDSSVFNYKTEIYDNYINLIQNYFRTDSLKEAKIVIDKTLKLTEKDSVSYCTASLYEGLYYFRSNQFGRAQSIVFDCLSCYKSRLESDHQNIAETYLLLSEIKVALAKYDEADSLINKGKEITIKNYGINSARYSNYLLVDANIKKIVGNYSESEDLFYEVLNSYNRELGSDNYKNSEVLSGLADLEVILGKFKQALIHSNNSLLIAEENENLKYPGSTWLINNAGYVNYSIGKFKISKSLYQNVLKINNEHQLDLSFTKAVAFNGLGLLKIVDNKFYEADTLFRQSLSRHLELFSENHPSTAIIYLNYSNLRIAENKLVEARDMLTKSLEINSNFFEKDHVIFADIFIAFGDLSKKEKQGKLAEQYYQKALNIYTDKFNYDHYKIEMIKDEIKNISFED